MKDANLQSPQTLESSSSLTWQCASSNGNKRTMRLSCTLMPVRNLEKKVRVSLSSSETVD
jgi:hypothetical protein